MDLSLISVIASAIGSAKELGKAALGVRDFNEMAPVIHQLNDHLLKAQDAMFRHNTELLTLQQEKFETTEELRKLKEALADRGRYTLFELSDRVFVYRMNVSPVGSHVGDPVSPQPQHDICQPCFDKGIKAVLKKHSRLGRVSLVCPHCEDLSWTGETEPFNTGSITKRLP